MIIKLFLLLAVLSFLLGNFVKIKMGFMWMLFNYYIFASFFIAYTVIHYSNFVNYILYVVFTAIVASIFFMYKFPFVNEKSTNILIWLMFILSVITFGWMIKALYNYKTIFSSEALIGENGDIGERGENGAILDSDMNSCSNQLNHKVEALMRKHKEIFNIKQDPELNYFNNIYMKRHLNRICRSKRYAQEQQKTGRHYEAVTFLNSKIEEWINIILGYHYGLDFLEDHFFTEHNWNTQLLSKDVRRDEHVSPFSIIMKDPVWGWK
jgi:hypothetical protein